MNGNLRYSSTYGAQMVFYQAFIDDSEAKFSLPESPITELMSCRDSASAQRACVVL
jgi:hypothetical protein